MINRRNYYRILQVQPDAPLEVIRASYRTMMRELQLHPDLGGDHWNAKVLNEAYATLSNAKRRAAYDKKLYERYTKNPQENKQSLVTDFCPFCNKPLARNLQNGESCPNCKNPLRSTAEVENQELSRRSIARISKSGKIRYFTSWPQKGIVADLVDMSPNGMRFLSAEVLPIGSKLKITAAELRASAEVVNTTETEVGGELKYAVGVRFLAVSYSESKGAFFSGSA